MCYTVINVLYYDVRNQSVLCQGTLGKSICSFWWLSRYFAPGCKTSTDDAVAAPWVSSAVFINNQTCNTNTSCVRRKAIVEKPIRSCCQSNAFPLSHPFTSSLPVRSFHSTLCHIARLRSPLLCEHGRSGSYREVWSQQELREAVTSSSSRGGANRCKFGWTSDLNKPRGGRRSARTTTGWKVKSRKGFLLRTHHRRLLLSSPAATAFVCRLLVSGERYFVLSKTPTRWTLIKVSALSPPSDFPLTHRRYQHR